MGGMKNLSSPKNISTNFVLKFYKLDICLLIVSKHIFKGNIFEKLSGGEWLGGIINPHYQFSQAAIARSQTGIPPVVLSSPNALFQGTPYMFLDILFSKYIHFFLQFDSP